MNKIKSDYYEKSDFSNLMKDSQDKKVVKSKPKRITINISDEIYSEAHNLDNYMNMGYQNVLKTAMFLGLKDLEKYIIDKKDIAKILTNNKA
jgi:hypothetical protein